MLSVRAVLKTQVPRGKERERLREELGERKRDKQMDMKHGNRKADRQGAALS